MPCLPWTITQSWWNSWTVRIQFSESVRFSVCWSEFTRKWSWVLTNLVPKSRAKKSCPHFYDTRDQCSADMEQTTGRCVGVSWNAPSIIWLVHIGAYDHSLSINCPSVAREPSLRFALVPPVGHRNFWCFVCRISSGTYLTWFLRLTGLRDLYLLVK